MHNRPIISLLVLPLVLAGSLTASAQEPVTYSATYQASSSGLSATAHRSLEKIEESQYLLQNTMEVTVVGARLGSVKESSVFNWVDGRLQPIAYRYSQSGISRKRERISFDWDNNIASSSEDDDTWQIPVTNDVMDKLGYQLFLRQKLQKADYTPLEISIIDTDKIENQVYRVTAEELIDTPLGKLNAIKVERVREDDNKRQTAFWLASDWDMLLVRLLQTSGSGSVTELVLEEAVVNGEQLTALP